MRGPKMLTHFRRRLACCGRRCASATLTILLASTLVAVGHAEEAPVAKIAVSASPAASYFGDRLIEGVMDFRGHKYLLTLQGISGPASSVASVFGLRRASDIVGPYTQTGDTWRNASGVTIKFNPPVTVREGPLRIDVASRIYPKASTGQGEFE